MSSLICLYLKVNSSPNGKMQISHLSSKKVTELFFLTTAASLSCPFYLKCLKSVLLGDLLNLSVTACLLSSTVSGTAYPVLPNYSASSTILAKLLIVVMKLTSESRIKQDQYPVADINLAAFFLLFCSILPKSSRQARYASKTIPNDFIHKYASKIKKG